jgi:hypothetical protein
MELVRRLVTRVIESEVSLDREDLFRSVPGLLEEEAPLAPPGTVEAVIDSLIGMGPIEPLLRDDRVSDVLVNGPDDVWVERDGLLERTEVRFEDGEDIAAAVERIIGPLGLRIDLASPTVDARLPDGSRLHATAVSPGPSTVSTAWWRPVRFVGKEQNCLRRWSACVRAFSCLAAQEPGRRRCSMSCHEQSRMVNESSRWKTPLN